MRPLVLLVHDDLDDGNRHLTDFGQDFEEKQPPTCLDLTAKGVAADISPAEHLAGDGILEFLGSDARDIAGRESSRRCGPCPTSMVSIGASSCRSANPGDPNNSAIVETTFSNKEVRSNYKRFLSSSGTSFSPPRQAAGVAALQPPPRALHPMCICPTLSSRHVRVRQGATDALEPPLSHRGDASERGGRD